MNKRLFSILLLCTGYSSLLFAQIVGRDSSNGPKVYFFKYSGQLLNTRDSADFTRTVTPDSSDSKLFVVKDIYRNGKTRMSCKSLTHGPYYRAQGAFIEYYLNGNRSVTATYDNGKIVGDRTIYYPNGKLYYIAYHDTSTKRSPITEVRDSTGVVLAENGNGTWVVYTNNFKSVFGQGPIVNGFKDGEWKGTLYDTLTYVCTYNKGVSVSGTSHGKSGSVYHFTKDEVEPSFEGGVNAFYKFLASNVHYPKGAKENYIQGKVFLSFTVEKDGNLADMRVVRGIGWGCDEEALRALRDSPNWKPGYQFGIPVRVQYSIPITFALQNGE